MISPTMVLMWIFCVNLPKIQMTIMKKVICGRAVGWRQRVQAFGWLRSALRVRRVWLDAELLWEEQPVQQRGG